MKLLTKKIIAALPTFNSTEPIPLNEKIVICKFFTPDSNWTWFVFEGEAIDTHSPTRKMDYQFFGMVHGFEKEMGDFLLSELDDVRGSLGLPIERDRSVFKQPYHTLIRD